MKPHAWCRVLLLAGTLMLGFASSPLGAQQPGGDLTLTFDQSQTAVLDPAQWDEVLAGELYFDAVRAMLVRFPGFAQEVHARLQAGQEIESASLVLHWARQEGPRPERGRYHWGAEEAYEKNPGRWHVEAWPLLRPWSIEPGELGPTFNAWLNGLAFWTQGGARHRGEDLLPLRLGPQPLHEESQVATLDLMPLLASAEYAPDLAGRLRALEDGGLWVRKHELYDLKYTEQMPWVGHDGVYDWRVGTGYLRLWVEPPQLVVRLRPAQTPAQTGALPPAADLQAIAQRLRAEGPEGSPSVYYPEDLPQRAARMLTRPETVPAWQWERMEELRRIGGGIIGSFNDALLAGDREQYMAFLKTLMLIPPRHFHGHRTTDYAIVPFAYEGMLPPGVVDHLKLYWEAFTHPEVDDVRRELERAPGSGAGYFRAYCLGLGTQNFNFNAIAATLLAGQLLEAPMVLRDARLGLENLVMRTYAVRDGGYQELGDTYYLGITVAGARTLARYAEDPGDQLMGEVACDRLMESLVSAYHPGLRRIVHPQMRGWLALHFGQDGPNYALHTVSRRGTLYPDLTDFTATAHGINVFGEAGASPPALMSLLGPWGPEHWANVVDDKPLPWRVIARHWQRRPLSQAPGWHVNYLGHNYALASREDGGVTPVVAQWRREPRQVERMEDLSTLVVSFGVNGRLQESTGFFGLLHHDQKLAVMKILPERVWYGENPEVRSLHASAGVLAFGDVSEREVWINGERVEALSGARPDPGGNWRERMVTDGAVVTARQGDVITIRDGVTYLGLIPLAANPAHRDREVVLSYEHPLLLVHSCLYDGEQPLDIDAYYAAEDLGSAGFIVEMGDIEEYGDFAAFRRHMQQAALEAQWQAADKRWDLTYASGEDRLEMGFLPIVIGGRAHVQAPYGTTPSYRRVNGEWPYLPEGIHRDSPWAVQGMNGRVEKNGAVLEAEPERRIYLQAEPVSGIFTAYNLLPDPTRWALRVPGGLSLESDGRVSLLRVTWHPAGNHLSLDYAPRPEQRTPDMAEALLLFGAEQAPQVERNGRIAPEELRQVQVGDRPAWLIPLRDYTPPEVLEGAPARWQETWAEPAEQVSYLRDWMVVGPFDRDFRTPFGPEQQGVDLRATYRGAGGQSVRWQRVLARGEASTGPEPVDLLPLFQPEYYVSAYAWGQVYSDAPRRVTLYTGSNQDLIVWVNGRQVLYREGYRMWCPDQDRTSIRLRPGVNTFLLKLGHGWEGWEFSLRLADEQGRGFPEGVRYLPPDYRPDR